MQRDDGCGICAMLGREPEDGWVYADRSWVAGILPGLEVPGWLVLALRRHAEDAAPLLEDEAADLGPAVRRLSAALVTGAAAERVYLQAYGEVERHWHLLLSARGADVAPEHRHVQLFAHRAEYLDPPQAQRVAGLVRAALAAPGEEAPQSWSPMRDSPASIHPRLAS